MHGAEWANLMGAHLCDARIDLRGQVIPEGQMSYPPDPGGCFPAVTHTCLRLRIVSEGKICLDTIEAERDTETGFLMSRAVGPSISLPEPISVTILNVLRGSFLGKRQIKLDAQEGHLFFDQAEIGFDQKENRFPKRRNPGEIGRREAQRPPTYWQSLSDWSLDLTSGDDGSEFKLRAQLYGQAPPAAWQRDHGSFWPDES
ncbi:MAG: hypothetical protein WA840_02975 [Caulobacteraceae bacterium]